MDNMKQTGLWIIRVVIVLGVSVVLSCIGLDGQTDAAPTMFTVIGIVYSLAVGYMLGFSFQEINDNAVRKDYVESVRRAFLSFTALFVISTLLHTICPSFSLDIGDRTVLDYAHLILVWDAFTLLYFCFNFNELRKLRNRVDECIRQGRVDAIRHAKD